MEGTIRKLVHERGFGFIHAQNGQDVFFHRSSLKQLDFERLREGLNVEFEVERSEKGPRAANVRLSWTERKPRASSKAVGLTPGAGLLEDL